MYISPIFSVLFMWCFFFVSSISCYCFMVHSYQLVFSVLSGVCDYIIYTHGVYDDMHVRHHCLIFCICFCNFHLQFSSYTVYHHLQYPCLNYIYHLNVPYLHFIIIFIFLAYIMFIISAYMSHRPGIISFFVNICSQKDLYCFREFYMLKVIHLTVLPTLWAKETSQKRF